MFSSDSRRDGRLRLMLAETNQQLAARPAVFFYEIPNASDMQSARCQLLALSVPDWMVDITGSPQLESMALFWEALIGFSMF